MSEHTIGRREIVKTLLTFGGVTFGGVATEGQTPVPPATLPPPDSIAQDQKLIDAAKARRDDGRDRAFARA